jgi:AraC-like DNA-binding protein
MHTKAHGLVPNKIIEVNSNLVESFLGRIYDPAVEVQEDGLKVFKDPSFRILLVTNGADPVLLKYRFGAEKANEMLAKQNNLIRDKLAKFGGREVEHGGNGFIASFSLANKAINCAIEIRDALSNSDHSELALKLAVNGGEPVENSDTLFGDTIQLANRLSSIAKEFDVSVASAVKELVSKDQFKGVRSLSPQDENVLELIFNKLEEKWHDPDFSVPEYCQAMAMSQSQLYRKTVELCGLSPNSLLKEFRLEKAKELMNKQRYNISQITFDSGFTSPSYFTKCFKKKYGLLPMEYVDLLH